MIDDLRRTVDAGQRGRLVVFAGSGVSTLQPTSLPTWAEFNDSVLNALEAELRASAAMPADQLARARSAIQERQANNRLPPEIQAEVLARHLGRRYFAVLQCLDSDVPNDVHLGLAALAAAGHTKAIITTNFDRAFESAFAKLGAPVEVLVRPDDFRDLRRRIEIVRGMPPGGGTVEQMQAEARRLWNQYVGPSCKLLKLHGSTTHPDTLIDTLAQKRRSYGRDADWCIRFYRGSWNHWVMLGYSGADLTIRPDSMYLRRTWYPTTHSGETSDLGDNKVGWYTWLARNEESVLPVVRQTVEVANQQLVYGDLPDCLQPLWKLSPAGSRADANMAGPDADALADKTTAWAASLGPLACGLALGELLQATSDETQAFAWFDRLAAHCPDTANSDTQIHDVARIHESRGESLVRMSRFADARSAFERALAVQPVDATTASPGAWQLKLQVARMDLRTGARESAAAAAQEVLAATARRSPTDRLPPDTETLRCEAHLVAGEALVYADPKAAYEMAFAARAAAERAGDPLADARGWLLVGECWMTSMTDQAERAFRKAAEAFRRYGDDRGLARAAWGAAECSFILRPDDAPSQLDDLREASGRAAAAHDHEGLALVQIAMSFALWKGHKRQDALAHLAGANQALMDQPYAAALARLAERTAEIHAGTDPELTRSRFADAEGKWRELGATEHADRLKARSEA